MKREMLAAYLGSVLDAPVEVRAVRSAAGDTVLVLARRLHRACLETGETEWDRADRA